MRNFSSGFPDESVVENAKSPWFAGPRRTPVILPPPALVLPALNWIDVPQVAYDDIKNRKGRMIDGIFVKDCWQIGQFVL